jgi:hypothetical protein
MHKTSLGLLPYPQHIEFSKPVFTLPENGLIVIDHLDPHSLYFTANQFQKCLKNQLKIDWEIVSGRNIPAEQVGILLRIIPGEMKHKQGYDIKITEKDFSVIANSPQGIFYGIQTIKQLVKIYGKNLPALRIIDFPDFPNRGVMLDISRDKVPSMNTLFHLIDLLASWKINQFQLYTEHTFAYRNHPIVWQYASPITGEEIMELDAYCKKRFVELVPNQNSFGHMRRWLIHDQYRHLSECPEGCNTEWGYFEEPFTLYPGDPNSFNLIKGMYEELLPHFSSVQFNVGCDETVDLGKGRSKILAEEIGAERIYLDFLMKIYNYLRTRGNTMQFWGDILVHHRQLVPLLPRDVIALEWGYDSDHPFDVHGKIFAESGIPFYVCPGTSSWNSLGGRTKNAVKNLINAAENGVKHGAIGYLITDWGDNGHWQPLPVSYLGFAQGAGVAWSCKNNKDLNLQSLLDLYAFHDDKSIMGSIAYEFGTVHEVANLDIPNSTILFQILQAKKENILNFTDREKISRDYVNDIIGTIKEILDRLDGANSKSFDAGILRDEFEWIGRMLLHSCYRAAWIFNLEIYGESEINSQYLIDDVNKLAGIYEKIWMARNRLGGYSDSLARILNMRADYING